MANFQVSNLGARPGERTVGYLDVARRADGNFVRIPIILVHGRQNGPVICVDGGIHGDEYEGVEAIMRVGHSLDPNELCGTFIGVPIVNMPAYEARERENPFDRYAYGDINRCFPGREHGSITERLAYVYFHEVVSRANYLITFHSGGNYYLLTDKITYEETGDPVLDRKTFEFTRAFGVDILWRNLPHDGMLASAAVKNGIPTSVPEIGGSNRAPDDRERHVTEDVEGILSSMYHLGMLDGEVKLPEHYIIMEGESHIYCNNGGFMRYEPSIRPKARIQKGEPVGKIFDPLGREIEQVFAQWDGIVTTMRTMPVLNPGDWFIGLGRIVEEL